MSLFASLVKSVLKLVIVLAIIAGIVFGIYKLFFKVKQTADNESAGVQVEVVEFEENGDAPVAEKPTKTDRTISKTGLIQAGQEVSIYPEISAKVSGIYVKEGQKVVKGQILAVLGDSTQLKSAQVAYESAAALLSNAGQTLSLVEANGQVNESTYQNQIAAAQINLQKAHTELESAKYVRYEQQEIQDINSATASLTKQQASETTSSTTDTAGTYQSAASAEDLYGDYLAEAIEDNTNYGTVRQRELTQYQGFVQDRQNILQMDSMANQLALVMKQLQMNTLKTKMDVINAKNQIIQLQQQLESASINLAAGRVTSPINGVLVASNVVQGETVNPQASMFEVVNFDSVIIEASITPAEYFELIESGKIQTQVKVLDKVVPAKIAYISPAANNVTRTIPVKVEPVFDSQDERKRFIPNTFARIEFMVMPAETPADDEPADSVGFKLPVSALKFRDGKILVATVTTDNKVTYKTVTLAPPLKFGLTGIKSGLNAGDKIIVTAIDLPEGATVKIS